MGENLLYYRGRWVPRSHFYDYGEEMIYMGPPRRSRCRNSRLADALIGLVACGPLYAFIIGKLLT